MTAITKRVLESVATIQEQINTTLGASARFFIKGGAAIPLLLEGSVTGITSDVDTYLSINPAIKDPEFEAKRAEAMKLCIRTLLDDFKPTLFTYGSLDDTTMAVASDSCCAQVTKRFNISNPFSLSVYGSLISEGETHPLTLIALKYTRRQTNGRIQSVPILDIIIPKRDYALLQYFWETITPSFLDIADVTKPVPVMNTVSAYVNQQYAAFKTKNVVARNTRKKRANALLNTIKKKGLNTRKGAREAALKSIKTNEKGLFDVILTTLPNSVVAAEGGAGAGAGAASAASAYLLPASPPISPSPAPDASAGARFIPPLPLLSPPPYVDKYVTISPKEHYILRTWRDGMTDDIVDPSSGKILTRVTYVPVTDRNARGALRTIYYDVYANGKHYLRFDPLMHFFNPVTMKVYPLN